MRIDLENPAKSLADAHQELPTANTFRVDDSGVPDEGIRSPRFYSVSARF